MKRSLKQQSLLEHGKAASTGQGAIKMPKNFIAKEPSHGIWGYLGFSGLFWSLFQEPFLFGIWEHRDVRLKSLRRSRKMVSNNLVHSIQSDGRIK